MTNRRDELMIATMRALGFVGNDAKVLIGLNRKLNEGSLEPVVPDIPAHTRRGGKPAVLNRCGIPIGRVGSNLKFYVGYLDPKMPMRAEMTAVVETRNSRNVRSVIGEWPDDMSGLSPSRFVVVCAKTWWEGDESGSTGGDVRKDFTWVYPSVVVGMFSPIMSDCCHGLTGLALETTNGFFRNVASRIIEGGGRFAPSEIPNVKDYGIDRLQDILVELHGLDFYRKFVVEWAKQVWKIL